MNLLPPSVRRVLRIPAAIAAILKDLEESRAYHEEVARQHNQLVKVVRDHGVMLRALEKELVKLRLKIKELEEWDPDKTIPGRGSKKR